VVKNEYFHGGAPGISIGEMIIPPSESKSWSYASRNDCIFVVTDFLFAVLYAAMHRTGSGCVYKVKPIGKLEPDPDCKKGISFTCERAIVLEKIAIPESMWQAARASLKAN
jgi:hypothetical protein